jgi:hypothetical protein
MNFLLVCMHGLRDMAVELNSRQILTQPAKRVAALLCMPNLRESWLAASDQLFSTKLFRRHKIMIWLTLENCRVVTLVFTLIKFSFLTTLAS